MVCCGKTFYKSGYGKPDHDVAVAVLANVAPPSQFAHKIAVVQRLVAVFGCPTEVMSVKFRRSGTRFFTLDRTLGKENPDNVSILPIVGNRRCDALRSVETRFENEAIAHNQPVQNGGLGLAP